MTPNPLSIRMLAALVRAALIALGVSELEDAQIHELAGALLIVVSITWSLFDKYRTQRAARPNPVQG